MNKKNITIGIIGPTNSGKSTLLNNIIGEKLAIVTHKSQTTRSAFKGIKIQTNKYKHRNLITNISLAEAIEFRKG